MPSSRPNTIPAVIHLLRQIEPQSILDVGVGFGKWGHLFREYTDICESEREPERYQRQNWHVQIDGIEGHEAYLTEMHRYLYNEIHVGDALDVLPTLGIYDLVFLGDVIEHLEKPDGERLLREALAHAGKAVIVSTPRFLTGQGPVCGNSLEQHRCLWTEEDFLNYEGAEVKVVDDTMLLAVILKPDVVQVQWGTPTQTTETDLRRLRIAREQLVSAIPVDESLILVDEEQMRTELPFRHPIPFLERNGLYWGPPEDDGTAIAEFERLRSQGAKFIAFTWPCFWWLDYYRRFHRHLRERFKTVVDSTETIVFDLSRGPGED